MKLPLPPSIPSLAKEMLMLRLLLRTTGAPLYLRRIPRQLTRVSVRGWGRGIAGRLRW